MPKKLLVLIFQRPIAIALSPSLGFHTLEKQEYGNRGASNILKDESDSGQSSMKELKRTWNTVTSPSNPEVVTPQAETASATAIKSCTSSFAWSK